MEWRLQLPVRRLLCFGTPEQAQGQSIPAVASALASGPGSISSRCLVENGGTPLSKKLWSLSLLALALCLGSLPVVAQDIYNNLNSDPNNVYQCCTGWTVSGTGTVGTSF